MPLAYRTALSTRGSLVPRHAAALLRRCTILVAVAAIVCLVGSSLAAAQAAAQTNDQTRILTKTPRQNRIEPDIRHSTGELVVFSAADMQPVFEVLGPYFQRRTGIKLKMVYGSSGTLSQQIVNGAPADIFFSADYTFAERLVAADKADNINPYPYAKGLLVVWTRKDSPFNPLSVDDLARKDLKSVAIANPATAPYGRAAIAAMSKLGLLQKASPHFVQAESVGQAAQFALSGNAQIALISQTIAYSPAYRAAGTSAMFPLSTYMEIRQCAVVMKGGAHRDQAHILLNYITSDEIQNHLADLGLQRFQ